MTHMYTLVINPCVTITQYHHLCLITLCQVTSHHTRSSAPEMNQQLNMLTLANRTSNGRHTASEDGFFFFNSFKVLAAMHSYPLSMPATTSNLTSLAHLITSTSKGCKVIIKLKLPFFVCFCCCCCKKITL